MDKITAQEAYNAMVGLAEMENPPIPWAFARGEYCIKEYSDMLDTYERLRKRLGVQDEDRDVEDIINAFMNMQQELCLRMFRYGILYGTLCDTPARKTIRVMPVLKRRNIRR